MLVAVCGGAGYIGSHFVRLMKRMGHDCVVFDNFSTGHVWAVPEGVPVVNVDLCSKLDVQEAFKAVEADAVVHFAALSLVGESATDPGLYYRSNITGALNVLDSMIGSRIKKFIFSST